MEIKIFADGIGEYHLFFFFFSRNIVDIDFLNNFLKYLDFMCYFQVFQLCTICIINAL